MTPTDSRADAQTDPIAMVTFNRVVRFLCEIKTDSERGCIGSHSHLNLKPAQFYCKSEFGPAETNPKIISIRHLTLMEND